MEHIRTIVDITSTVATAVATWLIWYVSLQSKKSQDRSAEQISDLYKAIVISTLLSSNTDASQLPTFISKFKEQYEGKTIIFKEK